MPPSDASRSLALLGPTNTGKTHKAVERMLEHASGMIGLPLRLLAREVYDRVSARLGQERVALVTGEEKRIPQRPDYWVCTTEAMPLGRDVDFLAVDEVQLATHEERGHVFTDRLLHARGTRETWFLGAATLQSLMERLVPAARQDTHPRLSRLTFAGSAKLSRLKPRSAVVAFSATELYEIAGKLRGLRGGTAVVLGALSPRARNAQVAMFQAGEVDYLVATDAIGMGLNLDVDHVAFASLHKFDGRRSRRLDDAEMAQIAGRAGRYLRDGTFGAIHPLELDRASAQRIELHRFEPVRRVRWRNSDLDFASGEALLASLAAPPPAPWLASVRDAEDACVLARLLGDGDVREHVRDPERLHLLWDTCQVPDFRGILFEVHVALIKELFLALVRGPLDEDFMAPRYRDLDRTDGDVHTLVARMAQLRTWAFVANQSRWLEAHEHWQEQLRALEDRLSDALHAALVDRFVARRGRAGAAPRPRSPARAPEPQPEIDRAHPFAALHALRDKLTANAHPGPAPAGGELEALVDASHDAFTLDRQGGVTALGRVLGKLQRGSSIVLPEVRLSELPDVGAGLRSRLHKRLLAYGRDVVGRLLAPLRDLETAEHPTLRAVAYQLRERLGTVLRADLESLLDDLDDDACRKLGQAGVRIGHVAVFLPALLRPPWLEQRATLLVVAEPAAHPPLALGRPSYPASMLAPNAWLTLGYVVLGARAARVDLVERAAEALASGAAEPHALRWLCVPKGELPRATRALRERLAR